MANPKRSQASIRGRLLRWLLIPLSVFLGAGVISDFRLEVGPANEAYDQALVDAALAISAYVRDSQGQIAVELSRQAQSILRIDPVDKIYIAIFAADGRLIFGDSNLTFNSQPDATNEEPTFYDGLVAGEPVRAAVLRRPVGNRYVIIQVAETTKKRAIIAKKALWTTLLTDIAGALITILLVIIGVKKGLHPVEELSAQIRCRSAHDLHALQIDNVPRELDPLVTALNRLFTLLTEASSSQKRFMANAAHQLRTPLAGLQTQLELLATDPDFSAARQAKLAHLYQATERISHLINQLLVLARAEPSDALAYGQQAVNLKELVESSASTYLDRAIERGIDLGFEIDPTTVTGNAGLLREMLGNLIDNALRYTPAGGIVTVRCGILAEQAFLEVEDSGPGIPAAEREKIFDRFYRMPGTINDGCGLGLAIVKEIAERHAADA
jgi:two-component system sensor histidine kinase TctE